MREYLEFEQLSEIDDELKLRIKGESEQLSYFNINLSCADNSGWILVAVQIVSRYTRYPRDEVCSTASFSFKVEPAAFDRFVSGLSRVSVVKNVGSKAILVNET